jgi:Tol biopolymer transport system component
MSIEVDWQIVNEDTPEPAEQPPLPVKPRRRLSHGWWVVLALLLVVGAAGFAAYYQWMYRTRLNQAIEPVCAVARLEAQAVAANDRVSFLALQDPDDAAWRAAQRDRFGQLERVGLPEFGWQVLGAQPSPGNISLQPGGVQLDVTYRFSVTRPLPDGPVSVTLQVPQFYKNAASGWVRAKPGTDYWGPWRTLAGRRFAMRYTQRDASVLEELIPRMDEILGRVCDQLPCPPQPVYVTFENAPDSFDHLSDLAFESDGFSLSFVSPHLIGLPADARSRDELYRVIGTRVVQALVYEASGRHLNMRYWASQEIVRWELTRAGLAGPFITPAITRALAAVLRTSVEQQLRTLPLQSISIGMAASPREALMPLALAFIEQRMGTGSVTHMLPAIPSSRTLGDAIRQALNVDPATLESGWRSYLRQQANSVQAEQLPTVEPSHSPPDGELALSCATDNMNTASIWRIRTDGRGLTQITSGGQMTWLASWSPDGRWLTYIESDHVSVMEADSQKVITIPVQGWPGWLPDGRLIVSNLFDEGPQDKRVAHVVNVETGEDVTITGTYHTWSPDGTQVAYYAGPTPTIWMANADGSNARQVAEGGLPVWSPDSKQLAFWGVRFEPVGKYNTRTSVTEIQVVDLASGTVRTLARKDDWLPPADDSSQESEIGSLAWSPDGSLLAVGIQRQKGAFLFVLSADTGAMRARERGTLFPLPVPFIRSWSPDSRYVVFVVVPDSSSQNESSQLGILDVSTSQSVMLPSIGLWDWSPDGKWLAVAQMNGEGGVWLVTPDLTSMRQLAEGMNCIGVAWRP